METVICGSCGSEDGDFYKNRCRTCDALHTEDGELAKFNVKAIPQGGFVTGMVEINEFVEPDLRKALGLADMPTGKWNEVLEHGSYKTAVMLYEWEAV